MDILSIYYSAVTLVTEELGSNVFVTRFSGRTEFILCLIFSFLLRLVGVVLYFY